MFKQNHKLETEGFSELYIFNNRNTFISISTTTEEDREKIVSENTAVERIRLRTINSVVQIRLSRDFVRGPAQAQILYL